MSLDQIIVFESNLNFLFGFLNNIIIGTYQCWAIFWNKDKHLPFLYANIYPLHQWVSKFEKIGVKNL